VTIPEIVELLKRIRWNSFHTWIPFHTLIPLVGGALAEFLRHRIKRRNARLAQHWPIVDGKVLDIDVAAGTKFFGSPRQFNATFKYSYTVLDAGVASYFSGSFSRLFPDQANPRSRPARQARSLRRAGGRFGRPLLPSRANSG
jgi:hypothetical protein